MRLSERRKRIIEDVARFRLLPSSILHARHFAQTSHRVALNELNTLTERGLLAKRRAYHRVDGNLHGPPPCCYLWLPANHRATRDMLLAQDEPDTWTRRFLPLTERYPKTDTFSQHTAAHEIGVSAFFDWLERSIPEGWTLVFWERYLNRDERMTGRWMVTRDGKRVERRFNPDGFFCVRSPDGRHYFRFLEFDRKSAKPGEYEAKLDGYIEARRQGHFANIVSRVCTAYAIPLSDDRPPVFYVLTVTHTATRRNDLMRESEPLDVKKNFLFATIDDLKPGSGFAEVWLRGQEFFPLYQHPQYPKDAIVTAQIDWLDAQIAELPRVSIISN